MLKILVAIQYQIVRDGVKKILAEEPEISVSGAVDNYEDFSSFLSTELDIIVLDLDIPNLAAQGIIREVLEKKPEIRFLAISESADQRHVKSIMKASASGFILKKCSSEDLIKAIKQISKGKQYICDDMLDLLMEKNKETTITNREQEVLHLICKELTNREIAGELSISIRTVDTHRRHLLQKTGAKNTAGLVKYAIKYDLFSL